LYNKRFFNPLSLWERARVREAMQKRIDFLMTLLIARPIDTKPCLVPDVTGAGNDSNIEFFKTFIIQKLLRKG